MQLLFTATAFGFDDPLFKVDYNDTSLPGIHALYGLKSRGIFKTKYSNIRVQGGRASGMELTRFLLMAEHSSIQIRVVAVEKEDQGDSDKTVTETTAPAKVGDVAGEGSRSVF